MIQFKLFYGSVFLIISYSQAKGDDMIKIHAPHKESFTCSEHWDGQFKHVGDALGTDCVIQELYQEEDRLFSKPFINQGFENEDWFGFEKDVLAPCDCVIESIHLNQVTNKPGIMTPGRATSVQFKTHDDKRILIAHLQEITVKQGQKVVAGEVVAKVGNNGYSRNPHVHIGAWDNSKEPLQIQFDQKTVGINTRKTLTE